MKFWMEINGVIEKVEVTTERLDTVLIQTMDCRSFVLRNYEFHFTSKDMKILGYAKNEDGGYLLKRYHLYNTKPKKQAVVGSKCNLNPNAVITQ